MHARYKQRMHDKQEFASLLHFIWSCSTGAKCPPRCTSIHSCRVLSAQPPNCSPTLQPSHRSFHRVPYVGSQVPSSCLCSILNAKFYLEVSRCTQMPGPSFQHRAQVLPTAFWSSYFFVFVFAISLPCLVAISRRNTHTVPNARAICHSRLLPTRVKSRTQSIPVSSLVVLLLLRNQSYTWSSNPRLSNNKMISCTIDRTFCVCKSTVRSGLEGTS